MKRAIDLCLSLVGLIASSPVLLALAVLIKLDSRGPVFYRGVRVGKGGHPFRIFKFRTMVRNADQLGGTSSSDDDPRMTRAGRFLRRYKLDELPQLLNVLAGHMSLVGPRPQVQWAVDLYTVEERELLSVRPGITDYASIRFRNEGEILRGSADPDRDYLEKIAPEKIRLGLEYVAYRSLWIDARIIAATLWAIVGGNPETILGSRVPFRPAARAAQRQEAG
jgi:lipopolysaccharide/colanic/teichoic acid biosynthesis glycosyltransferase